MRYITLGILALAGIATLGGCKAAEQRAQILQNQQAIRDELRTAREEIVQKQQQALNNQEASRAREEEMLRVAQGGVSTQQEILTLARQGHASDQAMTTTLDKVFKEIYGVGLDLRSAIGETRVVIEINNSLPLRVHSEIPTSTSEVVDMLPPGAVIFRAQKVSETWWKGTVLKSGEQVPVYFAVKYTKPLREEFMKDVGMASPALEGTEKR